MIAVLAMMMFSLFAVQQQEKIYFAQNTLIRQAVSAMLNGAAVERLEEIGSKGYDQAIADNETLTSSGQLASPSSQSLSDCLLLPKLVRDEVLVSHQGAAVEPRS